MSKKATKKTTHNYNAISCSQGSSQYTAINSFYLQINLQQ